MKYSNNSLGILILAAGASSRMGTAKQLLPWKDTHLLGHAIRETQELNGLVTVVLGANASEIIKKLPTETTATINPNWEKGLGSSIAHGVAELTKTERVHSLLITLADQPLMDKDFYKKLVLAHHTHPKKIIATGYDGRAGVPAIFPKAFFQSLLELRQDFGAKKLMQSVSDQVLQIDADGKHVDIDTQEDYESLRSLWGS